VSSGVKFDELSFGVIFEGVSFSVGLVAFVDLSLEHVNLLGGVVVCCVSSGRCSRVEAG